jgi:hypothetical protein
LARNGFLTKEKTEQTKILKTDSFQSFACKERVGTDSKRRLGQGFLYIHAEANPY